MEERAADLSQTLAEEEEKAKHLAKLKVKHEGTIADLEERLIKEQQSRQEFERSKRKLDTELSDIREQLSEKKTYIEEIQIQLSRREEELTLAMMKVRVTIGQVYFLSFPLLPVLLHASLKGNYY